MITHRRKPETAAIAVIPAEQKHIHDLRTLSLKTYHASHEEAAEWFQPEEYASRIKTFPEGQFVAKHVTTGEIIGYTSGMRIDYNPNVPLLTNWDDATGYG